MANAHSSFDLLRNQRGAIFVPALVMGALMVGAMFYVAAVGDAILFRTELQNAADVTSFQNAVWHARGMNVIAVLNILMSLALAVFAAIRMAEIVCFLVGLIPLIGAPFASAATTLVNTEPAMFRVINTALTVVRGAQEGVSAAVPYVAFAEAKATPTYADTIWPLSVSLVPPQGDARIFRQPPRRPANLPAALPIQDGQFGELCSRAVTFVPRQVVSAIERIGVPGSGVFADVADAIFIDIADRVLGLGDGLFCQPINGLLTELISQVIGSGCDAVQQADDTAEDAEAERRRTARENDEEAPRPPRAGRRSDGSRREAIDCSDPGGMAAARSATTFDVSPAEMWQPAKNGNVFLHSWVYAQGQPRMFREVQAGIGMADRGRLPTVTPSNQATAMSEYYFDCEEEWTEKCEPMALWMPNWTARIRRFRSPGEELVRIGLDTGTELLETLQQSVGAHTTDLIGDVIHNVTGLNSDNALANWLGEQIDGIPLVQQLNERIDGAVGGLREATGVDALLDPRRYTDADRIH
ncbi:MAG: hypothetical protein ABW252_17825 [Polyangiales bacterium]